jgi:D-alanyl-D-alanine dipeptidase
MKTLIAAAFFLAMNAYAQEGYGASSYAADDAHNHDGSHVEGQENCGTNYLNPGNVARLGSHTFMILGQDGPDHIIGEHRSGTPPHNYQFVVRVRLDKSEMEFYKKLAAESKRLPAFTTIYFKDTVENGKPEQLDRYFFCLQDLPKIFGPEKKRGDIFEDLFPMRMSLLKDPDYETDFDFEKVYYPGAHWTVDRGDVELLVYRYLPAYLEQSSFRQAILDNRKVLVPRLTHNPAFASEDPEPASRRSSFASTDGAIADPNGNCPRDFYLKKIPVPKTIHNFLLMNEAGANEVIAINYADQAPHNYQTVLKLKLTDAEMEMYRLARKGTSEPPLLQTKTTEDKSYFCLADLKSSIRQGKFEAKSTIYRGSDLVNYKLGEPVGRITMTSRNTEVLVNRALVSFMNPVEVAKDALGPQAYRDTLGLKPEERDEDFVDISQVNSKIRVEMRYFSEWNFYGAVVPGYFANKCYLTKEAAKALGKVADELEKQDLYLAVFDCYRPQTAVDAFVRWAKDLRNQKMKALFYPAEDKAKVFQRGYIDAKSGHTRGSTVDLTIVKKVKPRKWYREIETEDCRYPKKMENTGQLDMGTTYDCFSDMAAGASPKVSKEAHANREMLRAAMERAGFRPYSKEWWHFTLKDEPYKTKYFDFPVN